MISVFSKPVINKSIFSKNAANRRNARRLLRCGTALPLVVVAATAHAQAITEQSAGDIAVSAGSASGTPIAVELSSIGGAIDVNVDTVTGTTQAGVRDYVVGLETGTNGAISAQFGSITATGAGEVLGLAADTLDGDIALQIGSMDVDGTASAGIAAQSVNGDISIGADSIISRSTGLDSQGEFYEAVFGSSQNGSVTIDVGSSETFGTYASAIVGLAGGTVDITADSATFHSEGTAGVYAGAAGDISIDIGSISSTATDGQGLYANSSGGGATVAIDDISLGDQSEAARILASGDIDVTLGNIDAGGGVTARSTDGDTSVTLSGALVGRTFGGMEATGRNVVVTMEDGSLITAEGATWNGIFASGSESVEIAATDIETEGQSIRAVSANGPVSVSVDGNITSRAGNSISISAQGATVDIAEGSVLTGGGNTATVAINGNGSDVTIANAGTIAAVDNAETGIGVTTGGNITISSALITVSSDALPASGFHSGGISAVSNAGAGVSIDSEEIAVSGPERVGIYASTVGEGAIDIRSGSISNDADDYAGIQALSGAGDISISGGTVATSGNGAIGVLAQSDEGDVSVDLESVTTTGVDTGTYYSAEGVLAESGTGMASVSVGSAHVEGYAASAVVALGGGGAEIEAGEASSAGQFSAVLYAGSLNGDVSVDAGTVTLRGDQQAAVNAIADQGVATVSVDEIVNEGTLAIGVLARGGDGSSVTTGTIDADRYGVWADALNGNGAAIIATGNTSISGGYGLRGTGGTVSISTAADTFTEASGNAIWAQATESVTIDNQGTARSSGLGSAIHASSDGAVSIVSMGAEAVGPGVDPGAGPDGMRVPQGGIVALAGGPVSIEADKVSVAGEYRYGIYAEGAGGVTIHANDVELESADSVAVVGKSVTGAVDITTGSVVTTGASGVGVFGHTSSGDVTIAAGTTRVENEGMQGQFTGDAVVGSSDTGNVAITSGDAFSAALYGSAVVGFTAGNVSIASDRAETTGEGGAAIFASSSGDNTTVSVDSESLITTGAASAALNAFAQNGSVDVRVGDIDASAEDATGIFARSRDTVVTIDGDVSTGLLAVNAVGFQNVTVDINGSVASANGAGVSAAGQYGIVNIAEGASVSAATAGVVLASVLPGQPAFHQLYNEGTIEGATAVYVNVLPNTEPADVVIQNDGVMIGTSGYSVVTAGGDDVFELTNNSQVTGIADLGAGFDILALDFNDDATGGVGQVASTVNVEHLSVSSGSWLANGIQSTYDSVAIDEGSVLIVAENADGDAAIDAGYVALEGRLNLEFASNTEAGDLAGLLIEGAGSLHLTGSATVLVDDADGLQHSGGTFVENGTLLLTDVFGGDIATSDDGVFQLGDGGTAGDYTGDLVNDGTFVFARSDDYTFSGAFSGSGGLEKYGAGTLTFGGTYDFVGTTSVFGEALPSPDSWTRKASSTSKATDRSISRKSPVDSRPFPSFRVRAETSYSALPT